MNTTMTDAKMDPYLDRLADMVERRTGGIRPTREELLESTLFRSLTADCDCSTCEKCGQPLKVDGSSSTRLPGASSSAEDQTGVMSGSRAGGDEEHTRLHIQSKLDNTKQSGNDWHEGGSRQCSATARTRTRLSCLATIGQLVEPATSSHAVRAPRQEARMHDTESVATLLGPPSQLGTFQQYPSETPLLNVRASKAKVKTRPDVMVTAPIEQILTDQNAVPRSADSQVLPSPPQIPMSSMSKELFSRMLATDPSNRSPVHFDEFVAAMLDAGFTPKRAGRSSGSAVTFKESCADAGSIVFHCPHPDPRVDHKKLRTWGTRLQNNFGWELESLVERRK